MAKHNICDKFMLKHETGSFDVILTLKNRDFMAGSGSQHQREQVARELKWAWLTLGRLATYTGHKTDKDHRQ